MTPDRLFTPRFFWMCAFTFTVFLSLFQLIPTAPFHVRDLGGGSLATGLFLGFLTFASAWSGPFTGAFADRNGRRRTLIVASLGLAGFTALYSIIHNYRLLLVLVLLHGIVWSALLSASAAYLTGVLPPARRGEGIAGPGTVERAGRGNRAVGRLLAGTRTAGSTCASSRRSSI